MTCGKKIVIKIILSTTKPNIRLNLYRKYVKNKKTNKQTPKKQDISYVYKSKNPNPRNWLKNQYFSATIYI